MMSFANFLGGIVILFFGAIIRVFKVSGLIAGYNTASQEEKAKYDEIKLTKFVGNLLIVCAIILFLGGLLIVLSFYPFLSLCLSWGLFMLVIIGGVIFMNTGNRMKKEEPKHE